MHGNVEEWVEDDWHGNYTAAPGDSRVWVESPRAEIRVVRGGSWRDGAGICRSASSGSALPGARLGYLGFRVSRSSP